MPKTCFVIIGYGEKQDPYTNQIFDLDKTFNYIIEPTLKLLGFDCFRAIDKNQSGMIDDTMFEWIYAADLVVADISTLNPNVMYELGVRHVCKPKSTLIIGEKGLLEKKLPFDLSHLVVHSYEHLGMSIDVAEAERMKASLTKIIKQIELESRVDSPVYRLFPNTLPFKLSIPFVKGIESIEPEKASFADILEKAEAAKNDGNFKLAKNLFELLCTKDPSDHFLKQRLALVTYQDAAPDLETALKKALGILSELKPESSTNTETLGLMGSINKRLYNLSKEERYLKEAIRYYQRGFVIRENHYNGINLAFLMDKQALNEVDDLEAQLNHANARMIREKVLLLCEKQLALPLGEDEDKEERDWILLTQAEAKLGLGSVDLATAYIADPVSYGFTEFQIRSFSNQIQELKQILEAYKNRFEHT